MKISLHRSLLLLLAGVLLAALVPTALVLDRTLTGILEDAAVNNLSMAPMVLEDRNSARAEAMSMHAMEVARIPGLSEALRDGEWDAAVRLVASSTSFPGESPLLLDPDGQVLLGPTPAPRLLEPARQGRMVAGWTFEDGVTHAVALAPVGSGDPDAASSGVAGVTSPFDASAAETLAGLTSSEVLVLGPTGMLYAGTTPASVSEALASRAMEIDGGDEVVELELAGFGRYWALSAPLADGGQVLFVQSRAEALSVLPPIRRGSIVVGLLSLVLVLGVGSVFARSISRPVKSLAGAAERLAEGDFEVPLPRTSIQEVDRMSVSFGEMRASLQERLQDLRRANQELEDRQERLRSLQAEMIQRDRLVASGRIVAELAHEIRNPVANVRNCLEVIDRRAGDDLETKRFAEMAIDELLRMHELAEQMLDLNRPARPDTRVCDATDVAGQVVALFRAGRADDPWTIAVDAPSEAPVRIPPDALKQVLMSLVENAREAMAEGGHIRIEVRRRTGDPSQVTLNVVDDGPGVPDEIRSRIFDPFFTTKGSVRGVGLGLSVAEGIVRRYGGQLTVDDAPGGTGARFRIALLAASPDELSTAAEAET